MHAKVCISKQFVRHCDALCDARSWVFVVSFLAAAAALLGGVCATDSLVLAVHGELEMHQRRYVDREVEAVVAIRTGHGVLGRHDVLHGCCQSVGHIVGVAEEQNAAVRDGDASVAQRTTHSGVRLVWIVEIHAGKFQSVMDQILHGDGRRSNCLFVLLMSLRAIVCHHCHCHVVVIEARSLGL